MQGQKQRAIEYLASGRSLTVKTAMEELGVGCFTKLVSDLRRDGYDIRGTWKEGTNRYGQKTRFIEYKLHQEEQKPATKTIGYADQSGLAPATLGYAT